MTSVFDFPDNADMKFAKLCIDGVMRPEWQIDGWTLELGAEGNTLECRFGKFKYEYVDEPDERNPIAIFYVSTTAESPQMSELPGPDWTDPDQLRKTADEGDAPENVLTALRTAAQKIFDLEREHTAVVKNRKELREAVRGLEAEKVETSNRHKKALLRAGEDVLKGFASWVGSWEHTQGYFSDESNQAAAWALEYLVEQKKLAGVETEELPDLFKVTEIQRELALALLDAKEAREAYATLQEQAVASREELIGLLNASRRKSRKRKKIIERLLTLFVER